MPVAVVAVAVIFVVAVAVIFVVPMPVFVLGHQGDTPEQAMALAYRARAEIDFARHSTPASISDRQGP